MSLLRYFKLVTQTADRLFHTIADTLQAGMGQAL